MKNSDINININQKSEGRKESKHIQIIKWFTNTISNAGWAKIFKVYFVTFFFLATLLAGFYVYNVVNDEELLRETTRKFVDTKGEENLRNFVVTPTIQRDLEILLYTLNADRVFIFELHNGKKNATGLPFLYADMTYEETNRDRKVDRVYRKYQDIPLTMYKYPEYLRKRKLMIGSISSIEEVDYEFARCIKDDGGNFLALEYLNINGNPLGFIGLSYHDIENVPSLESIEGKLKEYGRTITELLDLKAQTEKKMTSDERNN